MTDCPFCGERMETKVGSYKKQTLKEVAPYCCNPDCKNFDQRKKVWYE